MFIPKDIQKYEGRKKKVNGSSIPKLAVALDRIIYPPKHTDSRRMHPMSLLNTPNSHPQASLNVRRCSSSYPVGELYKLCLQEYMVTAWPSHAHRCWLQRRTSTVTASLATPSTVRRRNGYSRSLLAMYIRYLCYSAPISHIVNIFGIKRKRQRKTGLTGFLLLVSGT